MPSTTPQAHVKVRLTEDQKSIISQLLKNRALTAKRIWQELPTAKSIQQVRNDLSKLKKLKMVKAYKLSVHKKGAPESYWLLNKKGAKAIGANYDSSYSRQLSDHQLRTIWLEIDMIREVVKIGGWKLTKPLYFNTTSNPKPEKTEQCERLTKAYQMVLRKDLTKRLRLLPRPAGLDEEINAFNAEEYSSLVPKGANDWLAYLDIINVEKRVCENRFALVLILCPEPRSERFWSERIEEYQKIASKIRVCALFPTAVEVGEQEEKLQKAGLQVVVVARLSQLLNEIVLEGTALK